ncbi:hypothetical protein SAMN05421854_104356 [Amycolatopsis rubida]|uniref:Uncharacterized protein n=1 Tax=Amycolatopsis rubida TaxID=112413 RepID=A0A1I5NDY3_9PSEU|nr:hypothetical protein SAMN05421854_104356 [Amycolatopsis rubida]
MILVGDSLWDSGPAGEDTTDALSANGVAMKAANGELVEAQQGEAGSNAIGYMLRRSLTR